MSWLVIEHIDTAYNSIRAHRMRSLLTTVGISIGVASITAILSLASGVSSAVNRQVEEIGGNVAVIRPGFEDKKSTDELLGSIDAQSYATSTLSETDVDALQALDDKLAVAPLMTVQATLTAGDDETTQSSVLATTPEFEKTTTISMAEGQFLDEATSDDVAILGHQLAIDLFGTENPIGQRFFARSVPLTVIGVLKPVTHPVNYNQVSFDHTAIVTLTRGKTFHQGRTQIQQINLSAETKKELQAALPKAEKALEEEHGERDFTIISGEDIAKPSDQLYKAIAAVMTVIAGVSLVVGGIGIMNIMLVGVAERTREIGIRKSVGASDGSIARQFLIESLIISCAGGMIGYVAGLLFAFVVGTLIYFSPAFTWSIALVALAVSVLVGVLFGLYPALRAANKDPIESLRQYR